MKRLLPIVLLAACAGETEIPEIRSSLARNTQPDVSDADMATFVAGNTAFATDLYKQVSGTDGNLFMSPHSISTALAMTWAGAAGNTATQMAETLHFTLPAEKQHAAFDKLDLVLASRAASAKGDTIPFRLTTANALFGQTGKTFEAPFLDTLAVNYDAGMRVLDFAGDPEGSRVTINQWVEDKTNDKIKELLPKGSTTGISLALTNAIYFSGAWAEPFDAGDTTDRAFSVKGGTPVQVPFLHGSHEGNYGEGDGWKAAELGYDGGDLAMVVVVPSDLSAFEASLDAVALARILDTMTPHALDLSLPKFKFDAPLGLGDALQALGMTDAFGAAADFSGIDGTHGLSISDVLHKGFVSIDEKGTEAAAATAVLLGDTAAPEPATLVVDRPFLFLIRDKPTGAILFLGRVVDPR